MIPFSTFFLVTLTVQRELQGLPISYRIYLRGSWVGILSDRGIWPRPKPHPSRNGQCARSRQTETLGSGLPSVTVLLTIYYVTPRLVSRRFSDGSLNVGNLPRWEDVLRIKLSVCRTLFPSDLYLDYPIYNLLISGFLPSRIELILLPFLEKVVLRRGGGEVHRLNFFRWLFPRFYNWQSPFVGVGTFPGINDVTGRKKWVYNTSTLWLNVLSPHRVIVHSNRFNHDSKTADPKGN